MVRNAKSNAKRMTHVQCMSQLLINVSCPTTTEAVVSEDMLVTHFLIQPDPDGVKLQGWNEKAFSKCEVILTTPYPLVWWGVFCCCCCCCCFA